MTGPITSTLPSLPTTVIGSYSVPEWLERLKTDFYQRRISGQYLTEIHEVAIKAAVKDQERAGIDMVSDGELRRDNDIDYLLVRLPGVQIVDPVKPYFFDYHEAVVTTPLPSDEDVPLGLADDFAFTRDITDRPIKFSFTGPFSLSRRLRNEAYADKADLVRALARTLNAEAHRLVEAGATVLQIDEPFLAGYPEEVDLALEAVDLVVKDVRAWWALHVCYGNRYARPSWEGHYDFLFPGVLDLHVDQLVLEFARKGYDDLELLRRYQWDRALGLGVIDVKSDQVESPELIAARIRRALDVVPPGRLMINPDCGLRHVPPDIARAKLRAMTTGTETVRAELGPSAHERIDLTCGSRSPAPSPPTT
jgi:5-methyltetrahydropteroyltriglutamate--homocysteine methyltransferase